MKRPAQPPHWLEQILLQLLHARNREPVAGDLHEAYADRSAQHGSLVAGFWYARQVLSLAPIRSSFPERLLTVLACFAALYGAWFGVMELVLRHSGYARREWIAGTLLLQAILTLSFLLLRDVVSLRFLVAIGCVPLALLVGMVVRALFQAADLEGYVILMALVLTLQIVMTITVLVRRLRQGRMPKLG